MARFAIDNDDRAKRREIAFRALALAFLIVAAFSVAGRLIFDLFGITLPVFRIGRRSASRC